MDYRHPTFLNIPTNATLIAYGDCFLDTDNTWKITCYFKTPTNIIATVSLAIEVLPVLALGRVYSKGKIKILHKEIMYFHLPSVSSWEKFEIDVIPSNLYKPHYKDECRHQLVYKIKVESKVIWLPVLELARILFLKTAENARYAFYEANLHGMASIDLQPDSATIRLGKQYPRRLLDARSHQEYLAWLLLNPAVTNSFCSIFSSKNENAFEVTRILHWIFDFEPMELAGVCLNCYGRDMGDEFFVHEIRTMGRVPAGVKYNNIIIDHPEDIKHINKKEGKPGTGEPPKGRKDVNVNPNVNDSVPPSAHSRHRVLEIPSGRLYFDAILEPERHFTEIEQEERKGGKSLRIQKEGEVNTGVTEGDNNSKSRKTDYQALTEPNTTPTDFFKHIRFALKHIQVTKEWPVKEKVGVLTHEKNRSFLKIAGVNRRYYCGEIELMICNMITVIEIDLTDKHGLTTLLLRLPPEDTESIDMILESLVEKAGRWDKELISQLADMCVYVAHPKDLSEKTEMLVYENWANRILREL